MSWHFANLEPDGLIYSPEAGPRTYFRTKYEAWLRQTLVDIWPNCDRARAAAIAGISPHSMRSGFAIDLLHTGMPISIVMKLGRWESLHAALLYANRRALCNQGNTVTPVTENTISTV